MAINDVAGGRIPTGGGHSVASLSKVLPQIGFIQMALPGFPWVNKTAKE